MEIYGEHYELEVRVSVSFHGSHSLPARPEQHEHRWEVEFSVCGPLDPNTGMVIDMLILARFFKPMVDPLDGLDLHTFPEFIQGEGLVGVTAKYPTCDTLAHYFLWKAIPVFKAEELFAGLRISQIKVSLFEPQGIEAWGHAIIRPKAT